MNWTEIYKDAVSGQDILMIKADPAEGVIDLSTVKPCRIIPCPGSYFSAHDVECEMTWDEEEFVYTDCRCEQRARELRDSRT